MVFEKARVEGNALVSDHALVSGNAVIKDNARVYGNAEVADFAEISGDAEVYGKAFVSRRSKIIDKAKVYGKAIVRGGVSGSARVYGSSKVDGTISGSAKVYGKARIPLLAEVEGTARVFGDVEIANGTRIGLDAKVSASGDYFLFREFWYKNRPIVWTRSNNLWSMGICQGLTGSEVIDLAYLKSELTGKHYEALVNYINTIKEL